MTHAFSYAIDFDYVTQETKSIVCLVDNRWLLNPERKKSLRPAKLVSLDNSHVAFGPRVHIELIC
jgi:hypothetical protein